MRRRERKLCSECRTPGAHNTDLGLVCGPCYVAIRAPAPGEEWLAALRFVKPGAKPSYCRKMMRWLADAETSPFRRRRAQVIADTLDERSARECAERAGVTERSVRRWRAAWRRGGWRDVVGRHLPRCVWEGFGL